jgi:hypothetical protein
VVWEAAAWAAVAVEEAVSPFRPAVAVLLEEEEAWVACLAVDEAAKAHPAASPFEGAFDIDPDCLPMVLSTAYNQQKPDTTRLALALFMSILSARPFELQALDILQARARSSQDLEARQH